MIVGFIFYVYITAKWKSVKLKGYSSQDRRFCGRGLRGGAVSWKMNWMFVGMTRADASHWVPMAGQAVSLIYKLAEHPDIICGDIIKQQAYTILGSMSNTGR